MNQSLAEDVQERLREAFDANPKLKANALWKKVRGERPSQNKAYSITLKQVKAWLNQFRVVQVYRPTDASKTPKFAIHQDKQVPFERVQMDIAVMPKGSPRRGGAFTAILVFIDTFSRYLLAYAMPGRQQNGVGGVKACFKKFMKDVDELGLFPPYRIDCDNEFATLPQLADEYGTELVFKQTSTINGDKDHLATAFVDRAIKTLRERLLASCTHENKAFSSWPEFLDSAVHAYNETVQSKTTRETPDILARPISATEVKQYEKDRDKVLSTRKKPEQNKLLKSMNKIINFQDQRTVDEKDDTARHTLWYTNPIHLHDNVRILEHFNPLDKRTNAKWTKRIYTVDRIEGNTFYYVSPLHPNPANNPDDEYCTRTRTIVHRDAKGEITQVETSAREPRRLRKYELLLVKGDALHRNVAIQEEEKKAENLQEERRIAQHARAQSQIRSELNSGIAPGFDQPAAVRRGFRVSHTIQKRLHNELQRGIQAESLQPSRLKRRSQVTAQPSHSSKRLRPHPL
jgi:hypothetical protein